MEQTHRQTNPIAVIRLTMQALSDAFTLFSNSSVASNAGSKQPTNPIHYKRERTYNGS